MLMYLCFSQQIIKLPPDSDKQNECDMHLHLLPEFLMYSSTAEKNGASEKVKHPGPRGDDFKLSCLYSGFYWSNTQLHFSASQSLLFLSSQIFLICMLVQHALQQEYSDSFLLRLLNFIFCCEQFKPTSLLKMKLSMLASA